MTYTGNSTAPPGDITASSAPVGDERPDAIFIAALVCFALGISLLLIALVRLLLWFMGDRKQKSFKKWWLRQLEHKRYIDQYSIRTEDGPTQFANSKLTHEDVTSDDYARPQSSSPSDSSPSHNGDMGQLRPEEYLAYDAQYDQDQHAQDISDTHTNDLNMMY